MNTQRARGFTLLEVMVALAIVSIGLIAVFNGIIQMAHSTSTLRERAQADWIAMNMISQIRISGDFPDVGSFDGSTEFAGREWRWEADISETGVTDLRRIDLSVAYEDLPDDVITIMAGFVSRAAEVAPARIDWWGAATPPADDADDADGADDADDDEDAAGDAPDVPTPPDAPEEEEDEE